jgi:hypothetical protein
MSMRDEIWAPFFQIVLPVAFTMAVVVGLLVWALFVGHWCS